MTKPSRAISRCNSAETFGGSAEPSGVCSVARRSAAPRLRGGRPAQGWFEVANAQPGQGALHSVDDARALPDQALALPVGPLGVLFGNGRDARHGAVAPFPAQPPQEPPLQQLGVEPVGLRPARFPRYGDTRGMDHMRLHPARPQPSRQPEAVPTSFEGQCNPRDLAAGLDRLVTPAMQQAKQPFCTRLQLLARLALNARKHTGNQPTRLAHLDDDNDCAILVQGDEGPAQVVRLGHLGTPSVGYSDDGAISSPPTPYHLSAGGRWIRISGSARDCTTVEVGSRASPAPSSPPAARPRLERATNGGSLGSAPGRDPAASPERTHRIPGRRCFRTRCFPADLPPGPHPRGKTRALPPCFYRRHRAHFPASLTGRFDLRVGTPACPGPLTAAIPDRLSRPTIMLSGFAPGSRIARDFGGNR